MVQALGNPSEPNHSKDANIFYENLRVLNHTILGWGDGRTDSTVESGSTTFGYAMDDAKYDTGHIIVVSYCRNNTEEISVENETLGYKSYLLPCDVYHHIVPVFETEPARRIVRANLKTIKGSIKLSITELVNDIPFPHVPASIAIPRLPISSLSHLRTIDSRVNVVNADGQLYAFKHYGIDPFGDLHTAGDPDHLLKEVMHLCRFDSQFIIKPIFVIVDNSLNAFRGYLMPYFAAGSLVDVLNRLDGGKSVTTQPKPDSDLSLPDASHLTTLGPRNATSDSELEIRDTASESTKMLDWFVKEAWAFQIISGVASLHKVSSFSGDLKLHNILLGPDGCLCLIDIAPTNGFSAEYLSPEQDIQKLELTPARDIFALGLILWALSEEKPYFSRSDVAHAPQMIWHESKDAAPMWYRELVHGCLGSVDQRPSAEMFLNKFSACAPFVLSPDMYSGAMQESIQSSRH